MGFGVQGRGFRVWGVGEVQTGLKTSNFRSHSFWVASEGMASGFSGSGLRCLGFHASELSSTTPTWKLLV